MTKLVFKIPSDEYVEDRRIFTDMVSAYIQREYIKSLEFEWVGAVLSSDWCEAVKPAEYNLLYGEGAYERLVFGGAPGL